jgi:hypothetical protein
LVAVLRDLRDLGRARRDLGIDEDVVALGRRAHAALMFLESDSAGDLEAAQGWLDVVYRTGNDPNERVSSRTISATERR